MFNLLIILHIYLQYVYISGPQFLLDVCMQPSFRSIYGLRAPCYRAMTSFEESRESFAALHGKKQNCYHSYHGWHMMACFFRFLSFCSERVLRIDLLISLAALCILYILHTYALDICVRVYLEIVWA